MAIPGVSFLEAALRRGNDMPLDAKVHLMELRMRPLGHFEKASFEEFAASQPGLERVLKLLAQSAVDICCSLLLDRTGLPARSYCDLLSRCEKSRILPASLVRRLSVELLLIDEGFPAGEEAVRQRHEGLHETARAFRGFFEHVKGMTEKPVKMTPYS